MENIRNFWKEIWDFCGIQGSDNDLAVNSKTTEDEKNFLILEEYEKMDQFPKWFSNKKLNFTKNLLYPTNKQQPSPHAIAVHFRSELGRLSRSITWKELRQQVQVARIVLKNKFGVVRGDRIGAYAHNCPEVLVYMLAGASLGAIFTSGSPDFGPTVQSNYLIYSFNYNYKNYFINI